MAGLLKKTALLLVGLAVLAPLCALLGYAIAYAVSIFVYSATLAPDTYEHDRDLFASIYGIMFVGSFLYVVAAGIAIFRFLRSFRKG